MDLYESLDESSFSISNDRENEDVILDSNAILETFESPIKDLDEFEQFRLFFNTMKNKLQFQSIVKSLNHD